MCDLTKKKFTPPTPRPVARRRLWELDRSCHCAILGTCLTLPELHKVIRQAGIILDPAASDYDAHRALVSAAGQAGHGTRLLQRFLDRKYRRNISQLGKLRQPDELKNAWKRAVQCGDVAGAFWALVTHPAINESLLQLLYGEVHMLSHLAGAANRADLKRLATLETRVAELKSAAKASTQKQLSQLAERDQLITRLERQLLEKRRPPLSADPDNGCTLASLRRELDRAQRQLERNRRRIDSLKRHNQQLQRKADQAHTTLEATQTEHQATEQLLERLLCHESAQAYSPNTDLGGRQVVYVGGRPSLSPHLRALVEQCHGEFEHHDGGMEESRANLHCLLGKADMVFCPIDCISHDACLKVKRYCKQNAKAFIPLRSSGLSTFAKELSQLPRVTT